MAGLKRRGLLALVTAIIGFIALGNGRLSAQSATAAITGTVRDATGAAVPGSAITVKHIDTGLTRVAESDARGAYSLSSLPVGEHELTAERMGFRREVRRGIDLAVGQEAVVDLALQVGSIDQQVTVTGEAPLVNTTLSSTSGLITESQVKDLPLNGRSFDQLITLNVGTTNNSSNTLNNASWNAFSVAGKRPQPNRFLINGIDWIGGKTTPHTNKPHGARRDVLPVGVGGGVNHVSETPSRADGERDRGQ